MTLPGGCTYHFRCDDCRRDVEEDFEYGVLGTSWDGVMLDCPPICRECWKRRCELSGRIGLPIAWRGTSEPRPPEGGDAPA